MANEFLAASGKQVSRKTVARRLRGGELYARRPVMWVPFTRQHRTARLQWCREHRNWTEQDWAFVLFSDESRFSLSSDCRRQLIWCGNCIAYRPENVQERDRYPARSVMVWINGRMRLHVVANETMIRRPNFLQAKWGHVPNFWVRSWDKYRAQLLRYFCDLTVPFVYCFAKVAVKYITILRKYNKRMCFSLKNTSKL